MFAYRKVTRKKKTITLCLVLEKFEKKYKEKKQKERKNERN